MKALHHYHQTAKPPRKNNQAALRKLAEGFVYVSSTALGVMGAYILWNNLPYSRALRAFFLPSMILGSTIINVQPFLDTNASIFAQFSPGVTPEIREKRAALLEALDLALNEIRAKNAEQFESIYTEFTQPGNAHAYWEKLLSFSLNPEQPAPKPKSNATKARGYFGWFLSSLSSLTNIQISYAEAKWLAEVFHTENESFVPTVGIISSILCIVAYGVLCGVPTQTVFENQQVKQGWEPSHPWVRKLSLFLSIIFGFVSAIPNASWPIILGTNDYEKSLAGPAFICPGLLNMAACITLWNALIDTYDRWQGKSDVLAHMNFLMALQSIVPVVAQAPDQVIDKLVTAEHLILHQYRNRHVNPASSDHFLDCLHLASNKVAPSTSRAQ